MIHWIKTHKLILLFALIIAFFLNDRLNPPVRPLSTQKSFIESSTPTDSLAVQNDAIGRSFDIGISSPSFEKVSTSDERLVIQNSSLSLLVENVRESGDRILSTTKTMGGFMVNASYNDPENEAFATITVRVPTDRLDEALDEFRSLAVKVTSENLFGTDVTEQFEDLDERITTLEATKTRFESILENASEIEDIIRLNQEIINTQSQIDSARGQQMALEDNARLTKITVFLSTDELALPYTPDEAFRPEVIFKNAVRSLLSSIQDFAGLLIWVGVYAIIWIPILLIIIYFKKRKKGGSDTSSTRTSRLN